MSVQIFGNVAVKQFTKHNKDEIFKELSNSSSYRVLLIAYELKDDVKELLFTTTGRNMNQRQKPFYTSCYFPNGAVVPKKIYENLEFDKKYFNDKSGVGMDYLDVILDVPNEPEIFVIKTLINEISLSKFK